MITQESLSHVRQFIPVQTSKKELLLLNETKHHRKPKSIGGSGHSTNLSVVLRGLHNDWHTLFGNLSATMIFTQIREDLVIDNIYSDFNVRDCIFDIPESLYEDDGGDYHSKDKLKRKLAWTRLFQGKDLQKALFEINNFWIDPLYFLGTNQKQQLFLKNVA